jgi:hypothetical protein
MRIYELYSALDKGDVGTGKDSIGDRVRNYTHTPPPNPHDYSGPWALETMGGAGGQTIVGAVNTAMRRATVAAAQGLRDYLRQQQASARGGGTNGLELGV